MVVSTGRDFDQTAPPPPHEVRAGTLSCENLVANMSFIHLL